jgi:hypothetical protein
LGILPAIAFGVWLDDLVPAAVGFINNFRSGTTNIPIAMGTLLFL